MSSISLNGDTSGSILIQAPAVAGSGTLTLPTGTATLGIQGPAFSAYRSTDVAIPSGVGTKVIFTSESFDTNSCYDTSTGRFTPNIAGYYQFTASLGWLTPPSGQSYDFYIAKNASVSYPDIRYILSTASQNPIFQGSYLYYLNGSTDYVEIYAYQGTGSSQSILGSIDRTWFQGFMVRGA
jgi:hypothetical protein